MKKENLYRKVWTKDWKEEISIPKKDIIGMKWERVDFEDTDGYIYPYTILVSTADGKEYYMNHYCDAKRNGCDFHDFLKEMMSLTIFLQTFVTKESIRDDFDIVGFAAHELQKITEENL